MVHSSSEMNGERRRPDEQWSTFLSPCRFCDWHERQGAKLLRTVLSVNSPCRLGSDQVTSILILKHRAIPSSYSFQQKINYFRLCNAIITAIVAEECSRLTVFDFEGRWRIIIWWLKDRRLKKGVKFDEGKLSEIGRWLPIPNLCSNITSHTNNLSLTRNSDSKDVSCLIVN